MSDIKRQPSAASLHNVHVHRCFNCGRNYTCNCAAQPDQPSVICIDCERGTYDPVIHGGTGQRRED